MDAKNTNFYPSAVFSGGKHRLSFRKDGVFRILMLSDIQERFPYDERITDFFNAVPDRESPDLILFGGDNCSGPAIRTEEEFEGFLACLTGPAEKHGIPWAHVFGNHDHDLFIFFSLINI